ncbi:hypothetical protein GCM10023314_01620 [Algibacter agarivorans]|uniref:Lipocalin-like domain-containing protein n=1 Tax=Algibacter agarivorans TaxID=1109741 RepID=A0ABP9GC94_9FLAO
MATKKITLFTALIFSLILASCSSDGDSNSNSNDKINPPGWIQGTWINDLETGGFRITTDDICIVTGNIQQCYKDILKQTDGSVVQKNVKEVITNDYYSIEITLSSVIITYEFERVSDTEIEYIDSIMNTVLTKQ